MSVPPLRALERSFPGQVSTIEPGNVAVVERNTVKTVLAHLRDHATLRFERLTDLTVVDRMQPHGAQPDRFELVYELFSYTHHHRVRIHVRISERPEQCWAHSVSDLWLAANWAEREAWDLYGIDFRGHPNLRRLLLAEDFVGHPLRKDYVKNARQPAVRRSDAPPLPDYSSRLQAR